MESLISDPAVAKYLKKPLKKRETAAKPIDPATGKEIAKAGKLESALFANPSSITLSPSFWDKSMGPPPAKLKAEYQKLKDAFAGRKDINVKFNDETFSVTFWHYEKEVETMLEQEGLRNLAGPITLTLPALVLRQKGSFGLTSEGHERFETQEKALLEAADQFYKAIPTPQSVTVPSSVTQATLIPALLQKHQGICIGEADHGDVSPKQFLIEHMQDFKTQGVTTLFFEHLFFDSSQKWLDEYFHSSPGTEMPVYLKKYLHKLSQGQMRRGFHENYNYEEIVKAAKEAGIRIVGIDTTVSYTVGTDEQQGVIKERSQDRYKAMNFVAARIMKQEAKGGKFIAFMGAAHVGYSINVPGVSELMGCPSVVIGDGIEGSKAKLSLNVNDYLGQVKHVGAYLEMPPPSTQ